MVREFQSVIGLETERQAQEQGLDIHSMIACVGGGSNAIGFFAPFLDRGQPELIGVEAGGFGIDSGLHASRMTGKGKTGIVQGYKSKFLIDDDGQVQATHSVSAGLDYPGIGPQLAHLGETGRIIFTSATDKEAVEAVRFFARTEGILFALESAHAGAAAIRLAARCPKDKAVVINMSGRGDKDIFISAKALSPGPWLEFLKNEVDCYET
jgi:tryptophan synthase beta chain